MQTTPAKRSLDFSYGTPSPSESKKAVVAGYILDVTSIMKGYYFYIQFQDQADNVVQMPVYNSKIQKTLSNFEASSDPVKIEVLVANDGKLKMGSNSQAYASSSSEVGFALNCSLKKTIQLDKLSQSIVVKDLMRILMSKSSWLR